MRKYAFKQLSLALSIFASILLTSCGGQDQSSKAETIKHVKVETINNSNTTTQLQFNGVVKEKKMSMLSFRVAGPLVNFNVQPGDYVQKGEVIAQIDQRDYQLQVQTTKAQFEQVKGEFSRYKELHTKDKIPANSYEKVEAGYKMAEAAYNNAINQLQDTELKAPFSGYIFEKKAESFQTVGAGMPIVSMIDVSSLEIIINVSESQISEVKKANSGFINIRNASVTNLPVKLLCVSEKTKKDGLYEVKYEFNNQANKNILAGMMAELSLNCQSAQSGISIPASSIFNNNGKTYVWIFNPATQIIAKREVEIDAFTTGQKVSVTKGIQYGETVVTAGVHHLKEGQKAQPINKVSQTNVGGLL